MIRLLIGADAGGSDWERVVVVWNRSADGSWAPAQLLLSQHTGYQRVGWAQIPSTLTTADGETVPRGSCDGRRNLDHPKVYIASAKHDMHLDKKTEFQDPLSQLFDYAFRSDDWWYFPKKDDYVRADKSTRIGRLIAQFEWGDADSTPPAVAEGLCDA